MENSTKFEVYGQEMLEKIVKKCGNSAATVAVSIFLQIGLKKKSKL